MPFIWNDKTFFERIKKQNKYDKFIFYPPLIVSCLFWFFYIGEEVTLIKVALISLVTATTFTTFVSLIFQLPNFKISEEYHSYIQTGMRGIQFLINVVVLYFVWYKIIQPSL